MIGGAFRGEGRGGAYIGSIGPIADKHLQKWEFIPDVRE